MIATIALLFAAVVLPARSADPAPEEVSAFVGVHVVPMNREVVLENRTVLIRSDRIVRIGPATDVAIPEGANVIDGRGKYLMPGLADMHVHVWCKGDLLLYVANGVTTVRNMSGSPLHLGWKKQIASGDLFGPTLFTTGPIVDSNAPAGRSKADTAEHGRAVVAEQKKAGYDFIKVYSKLTRPAYDAILAASREHGIPVVGHVPYAVSLEHALESGQYSIEHLHGYGLALEKEPPEDDANHYVRRIRAWEDGAFERIPALAKKTHESGSWICPTLSVYDAKQAPEEIAQAALSRPEIRYVFPAQLRQWKEHEGHAASYRSWRASDKNRDRMTKAVWNAGQRVLLGTDTANPFLIPGFSIHGELRHLVGAGLTPYQALRAGTHNAAEFVGEPGEFGAVAEGQRADLILIHANPLENVRHVEDRAGVMLRGRWYSRAELRERLVELAASYARE